MRGWRLALVALALLTVVSSVKGTAILAPRRSAVGPPRPVLLRNSRWRVVRSTVGRRGCPSQHPSYRQGGTGGFAKLTRSASDTDDVAPELARPAGGTSVAEPGVSRVGDIVEVRLSAVANPPQPTVCLMPRRED